jgi:hypothetical protein
MGAIPQQVRRPSFLEGITSKDASLVEFGRPLAQGRPAASGAPSTALPSLSSATAAPAAHPAGLTELLPPAPLPRPAFVPDAVLERLAHAVESLKLQTERLAELAHNDALEIGILVAERILEQEVSTNSRALMSLVRSAMRRLADSRTITVSLCATDHERVVERIKANSPDASALATVKLVVDTSLQSGDCRVESELGSVDGKLSTRVAEARRSMDAP